MIRNRKKHGKHKTGSLACQVVCGKNLGRPHFTGLTCRLRRRIYNKTNGQMVGTVYVLFIDDNRRFKRVKAALMKNLLTICEFLAN